MNGTYRRLFVVAAVVVFMMPVMARAIDAPHEIGSAKGYKCSTCHSIHIALNTTGFNNVCLHCHNAADPYAKKKPFGSLDFANPFGTYTSARPAVVYQTSHNWIGSDNVPKAGALPPTTASLNQTNVLGTINCARCHSVHVGYSTATNSRPFIRMVNKNDSLCLDCHRPRNTVDHTKGTHPVTVNYAAKAAARPTEFHATPVNANPANPTSAMKMAGNGTVVCTTCHGVHYTDSNSRTFDNASSARMGNLSTSRGMLLRTDLKGQTATSVNICTNCHKTTDVDGNARLKNHNGSKNQNVQCADCHGGHVDVADGTTPNVFLINRYMNISTQYGAVRNKKVMYQYTSLAQKNWNKDAFGVCLACHSPLPGTVGQHSGTNTADCKSCHTHSQGFSANCTQCHGYPPVQNVAAGPSGYAKDGARDYATSGVFKDESATPHATHAAGGSNYSYACDQCHKGFSHNAGTFQDVFISGQTAGLVAATGGTTPAYNKVLGNGNETCTTTYCHSNGAGVFKAPKWAGQKGTIAGQPGECSACHDAAPATNAHSRHIAGGGSGKGYQCVNCHSATVNGTPAITSKAKHVDGNKDVLFSGSVGGSGSLSGSNCSTVYCHSNGKGDAPFVAPVWGTPSTGQCNSCHRATGATAINTYGHTAHLSAAYGPNFGTAATACDDCHTYTGELAATHVNGGIEVVSANCTTNCHKHNPSEFVWTAGRVTCESCHTAPLSVIGGRTAPAKASFTTTGHGQAFANYSASRRCGSCHDANSGHIDGVTGNQKRIATNDNTLCFGCHNDAAKVPTVSKQNLPTHATDQGVYTMDCKVCHDVHGTGNIKMVKTSIAFGALTSTISYASSSDLVQLAPPYRGVCQTCHTKTSHYKRGANEGGNHPTTGCLSCHSHKNTYAFKPRACDECHGYPPAPKGFVASQASYSTARLENYSGGGGAHVKLGHLMANIRPSQGFTPCLTCHNDGPSGHMGDDTVWSGGGTQSRKANVSVKVDPTYKFNNAKGQWYQKQTPANSGSCWNVSCHFQPTPRWSDDK
ncbi:MAG: CxxxxCH/CxxCH domain-containing protein [Desulfuromonadales bacterium]|nr:MAG: CxxxxCH/CxxCH domain-containing protein [Desulfuromonadales bacterium]